MLRESRVCFVLLAHPHPWLSWFLHLLGKIQEPQRTLVPHNPAPKCVSYFSPVVKDWQKPWGFWSNILLKLFELTRKSCWFNLAVLVSAVTSFGTLQQDVLQKHVFTLLIWDIVESMNTLVFASSIHFFLLIDIDFHCQLCCWFPSFLTILSCATSLLPFLPTIIKEYKLN